MIQIIEIRAELVEATGLTQISTIRDGVTHAVKWQDLSVPDRTVAVGMAARDAVHATGGNVARYSESPIWLDWHSVWVEVEVGE